MATCGKTGIKAKDAQANPWSSIWSSHRKTEIIKINFS